MNMFRASVPGQQQGTAAPPPQPPADDDDGIDLGELVTTLWRGKWWIALFALLAVAAGAFDLARTAPTYQADALVQLEDRGGRLALPEGMRDMVETSASAQSEIEVMSSRMVLSQAVAELNLDWSVQPAQPPVLGPILERNWLPDPLEGLLRHDSAAPYLEPFVRPGERIVLEDFQVPPEWVGRGLSLEVTQSGYRLELPDGRHLDGESGMLLEDPETGFGILVGEISAPAGRQFTLRQVSERAATNRLRSGLSAEQRGRDSGILRLTMTGPSPEQAERMLDASLQAYVQQNISRSAAEAERSLEFIREQLPEAEEELRQAEERLSDFREEATTRALEQEDEFALGQELDFVSQSLLNRIARLESELRRLDQRAEANRDNYPESHPFFRQINESREEVEEQLSQLLSRVEDLPASQRRIVNLQRDVDVAQQIYSDLQTRAQEMEVLRASTVGSVRVVDTASASGSPIEPQRERNLLIAALAGLAAGMGFVLLRSWLRKGIRDASDLERFDLPVFATINYTPHADLKHRRRGALPILALTQPDDLVNEAFRSLRTSLHFGMLDSPTKALALTSSAPQAGKSFTAVNLAVVAAQSGQRVCLVDGDLRRGQLRRYFDLPRDQPGLAQVLAGDVAPLSPLVQTSVEGLSFLPTGRYPPNPSELLMRRELGELVATLDAEFDLIIFDTPPALAVTDPVIIGRATVTSILIARHDVTVPGEVEAVKKTFQSAGLQLAGAVLNGFDPRKARASYGYGYNYGYRYSYKRRGA